MEGSRVWKTSRSTCRENFPGAPDLRQRRNGNSNLFLRFFTNEIWGKKHLSLILLSLWPRFWGGTSGIFLKMAQTKGEGSKSIPVLINIHKSTGMFCTELRQAIPANSWWKWRWWMDIQDRIGMMNHLLCHCRYNNIGLKPELVWNNIHLMIISHHQSTVTKIPASSHLPRTCL